MAIKVKVGGSKQVRAGIKSDTNRSVAVQGEKRPVIVPDSIALGVDTTGAYIRRIDAGDGIIVAPEFNIESANVVIRHANTSSEILSTNNDVFGFLNNISIDNFGHATNFTSSVFNTDNFSNANNVISSQYITFGNTSVTLGDTTSEIIGLTDFNVGELTFNSGTITGTGDIRISPAVGSILDFNNTRLTNALDPIDALDVANRQFVDSTIEDLTISLRIVEDPTDPTDATNKRYVDALVKGLRVRPSVLAATSSDLGGTFTSGNTTFASTITLAPVLTLNIDGVTDWDLGDSLLVKDQTDPLENGSYEVVQVGSAVDNWIFQRTEFSDQSDEIAGSFYYVTDGTTNRNTGWVATVVDAESFDINTDAINFIQFQGEGTYTAGNGLSITGYDFSVNVDDSTIEINSDTLRLKDGGIANAKLIHDSLTIGSVEYVLGTTTDSLAGIKEISGLSDNLIITSDVLDVNSNGAIIVPNGNRAQRPTPETGMLRFNNQDGQFEGYDGSSWTGLGGVIDVDQDTFIRAETSSGADNDQLDFYTNSTLRFRVDSDGDFKFGDLLDKFVIDFTTGEATFKGDIVRVDSTGAFTLPDGTTGERPTPERGMLRYNTSSNQFEGYDGVSWTGLGGTSDTDLDTKITTESGPGTDEDELTFITRGTPVAKFDSANNAFFYGDVDITGDVTIGGSIQIGDQDTDGITVAADFESNLIPNFDRQFDLGKEFRNWHTLYVDTIKSDDEIVVFDNTGAIVVPIGTTAERPIAATGMLRFNSADGRFEGYDGSAWAGISGSVIDIDQDTKIIAETSAGSDNDQLQFFTANTLAAQIDSDQTFKVYNRFVIPTGNTAQRYATGVQGSIRYNTEDEAFEGYNGTDWGTLGGVKDADQDTFIEAESGSGADNDELRFFTAGAEAFFVSNVQTISTSNSANLVFDVANKIVVSNTIITGLASPVNPSDAVSKNYLENEFVSNLQIEDEDLGNRTLNVLDNPKIKIGRDLEETGYAFANNEIEIRHRDFLDTLTSGTYGNDGFIPRVRITETGHVDFATEVPIEIVANAIPNFTETTRDIIALMFVEGAHEHVDVVNDDDNDTINIILTANTVGNVTANTGIEIDYVQAVQGTLDIKHGNTSNVDDSTNTGTNLLQSITFDEFGHVQSITATNAASVLVPKTGDSVIAGSLTFNRFIDANDTDFFVDPEQRSEINNLLLGKNKTTSQLEMRDGASSSSYLFAGSLGIGFLDSGFNFAAYTNKNTGDWTVKRNVIAEKYIDADDQTYFLNPAGTDSLFKKLTLDDSLVVDNLTFDGSEISSTVGISLNPTNSQIAVNSSRIINVADPTSNQDAATKAYVDAVAQGLRIIPAALAATTEDLGALYNNANGTLDLGSGIIKTIDDVAISLNDRILVKDQTNAEENGSYEVTQVGNISQSWILTRGEYFDESSEIPGSFQFVTDGTVNAGTGYVAQVTDAETFVLGTDDVVWYQFSGAGTYTAGDGLTLTGTEFSISNSAITSAMLQDSGVAAGSYGSAQQIPIITVDAKGRITTISNTAVAGVESFTYDSSNNQLTIETGDGSIFPVYLNEFSDITVNDLTANNGLFSGDLTVNGTVNGRDIVADGARLDTLETDITVNLTGDVTGSDTSNTSVLNIVTDIANSGVVPGTYGSAAQVPIITVAADGRITVASNTSVAGVESYFYTTANNTFTIQTADGNVFNSKIVSFGENVDFGAGIDVTGNITVTGTVDGRDIAADGAKLDLLEDDLTVTLTGDVTGTVTSNTGTLSLVTDIAASGVTAGSFGSANTIPIIQVAEDGRITAASVVAIDIPSGIETFDYTSANNTLSISTDNEVYRAQISTFEQNVDFLGGIDVTGNITVTGTVDGRNVATDGAKLDRLEEDLTVELTGDVTGIITSNTGTMSVVADIANTGVTAGTYGSNTRVPVLTVAADGRITVASEQDVAGVDGVDWYSANSTLAISTADGSVFRAVIDEFDEITVNGDIIVSGDVDGRDVSSDGSKLDGIESGATQDQTPAEILTALLTVDGTGSNLDADLLDGQQGAYYLNYSNFTNTSALLADILTIDGGGSQIDADKLDGLHASDILADAANNVGNGEVTITANNGLEVSVINTFNLNDTNDTQIVLDHGDTSSVSDVNNSDGSVVQDITFDEFGHVQTVGSVNLDSRYYTETELNNGQLDNRYYTETETDNLLDTKVDKTVTVTGSNGLTGGGALSSNVVIEHADTSSQGNVSLTGGNVITGINVDTFGHTTDISSTNLDNRYYTETELNNGQLDNRYYTETELDAGQLDNRYYTETEADTKFVDVTGDTMSGELTVNADINMSASKMISKETSAGNLFPLNLLSFAHANYGSAEIVITAKDGINRHVTKLLVTHNGTTAIATEFGVIYTSTELAEYNVGISGTNCVITGTSFSGSTNYKIVATLLNS